MDQYASEFATRGVDGTQLLSLDSDKLKVGRNVIQHDTQISKCCVREIFCNFDIFNSREVHVKL